MPLGKIQLSVWRGRWICSQMWKPWNGKLCLVVLCASLSSKPLFTLVLGKIFCLPVVYQTSTPSWLTTWILLEGEAISVIGLAVLLLKNLQQLSLLLFLPIPRIKHPIYHGRQKREKYSRTVPYLWYTFQGHPPHRRVCLDPSLNPSMVATRWY